MGLLHWIWSFLFPGPALADHGESLGTAAQAHAGVVIPRAAVAMAPLAAQAALDPAPALLCEASPKRAATSDSVGNLDHEAHILTVFEGPVEDLLWRIDQRIEKGDFESPSLPLTTLLALEIAN